MKRHLRRHTFSLSAMLSSVPAFIAEYMRSRAWKLLLPTLLSVTISGLLLHVFLNAKSDTQRRHLQRYYAELTEEAFQHKDQATAELYLARLQSLSSDPRSVSFEFATRLYNQSAIAAETSAIRMTTDESFATDDPLSYRALVLLQSLAPRRPDSGGYQPAHLFLAKHWKSRQPATAVTTLLTLQHAAYGRPQDQQPALQLAKFLSQHNYNAQAVEVLSRWKNDDPQVQLALAANYSKLGQQRKSQQSLQQATELFQKEVTNAPTDRAARTRLSTALAAQGRILESMFVLADGCRDSADPALIDQLIERYTIWLKVIPSEKIDNRLSEIQLALAPTEHPPQDIVAFESQHLQLSSGENVLLPKPIIDFHAALIAGEGRWLVPLLLGTDHAAQQQFSSAITLLEEAAEIVPQHPVVANNLAWCLLQQHLDSSDRHSPIADPSTLAYAWQRAETAVTACPENIAFRETRGLIAASTGRWQIAVDDLQFCETLGIQSLPVQQSLIRARQELTP